MHFFKTGKHRARRAGDGAQTRAVLVNDRQYVGRKHSTFGYQFTADWHLGAGVKGALALLGANGNPARLDWRL